MEAYQQPTQTDKDLLAFVVDHCTRWRDWRDTNYLDKYLEYERIFRGEWSAEDKTRDSERSRIVTPATQQAVETRHAEIIEAIFGQGDFFDINDDLQDINGNPLDVEMLKAQMMEDFKIDKIRKSIDQIVLMAEIYGTGIGEVIVKGETIFEPTTQAIPGQLDQAAIGVTEKTRIAVKIVPVNPKNFLFDPNGTSIDDCMGVAVEKYVGIHKVVEGMEKGIYRKVNIETDSEDNDLEPTQEITQYKDEKVRLLTYYGLVPRAFLAKIEDIVDLFPADSEADDYSNMVEAIVVIANEGVLLKAEENPYMLKDRPIVSYQADTVPNRLLGRGTVEKSYSMQKAIDAQVRSHLDSLALTTSPMMGLDATRLPRGAKFEVKPGKAFLVNGNPSDILYPFKFGETSLNNMSTAKEFERMLLQATGTMDSQGMVSQGNRDGAGMSLAVATIIKKYKRTLINFQEDFLVPFIQKAAFRFMQFDPERYPSVDMRFIPTATLGIIAREYEQQQFIGLLQTLGPNTPVLPLILKGILTNSSLTNRFELISVLDQMSQPNPEAQQQDMVQMQAQMAQQQAQVNVLNAQAQKYSAEAQQTAVETELAPTIAQAKLTAALSTNLDNNNGQADFERRAKLAELMIKEEELKIKKMDVESNERIAQAQMDAKNKSDQQFSSMLGE